MRPMMSEIDAMAVYLSKRIDPAHLERAIR